MGRIGEDLEPIIIIPAELPLSPPDPVPAEPVPLEAPPEPVPV